MKTIIGLVSLTMCLGVGSARAQDKSTDTTARYFIIQPSIGNLQEAAMGRLAAGQAGDEQVRAFGRRMATDHDKAEAQLMQLIRARNFPIPQEATDPPAPDPMLQKLNGAAFDRIYVHMMASGHRQTVQLFEKYALTGKDAEVRAYAEQTLPVLKEHLAMITAIDKAMDAAGGR